MLRRLFGRLTDRQPRGAELFGAVVAEARAPAWYRDGQVPDTIDGRFAVLSTVAALTIVRMESAGDPGRPASVALTERFVEAMDAEHRQLGLGDPSVGKKVRKLVGLLGERVEHWTRAVDEADWTSAAKDSLYRSQTPSEAALQSSVERLRALWSRLHATPVDEIGEGRIA